MTCRHCQRKKPNRPRGLCYSCYYLPGVRDQYPSTSKFSPKRARGEEDDMNLDERIARFRESHPLWRPSPYRIADPRHNQIVDDWLRAGLPSRHPDDQPPDLS